MEKNPLSGLAVACLLIAQFSLAAPKEESDIPTEKVSLVKVKTPARGPAQALPRPNIVFFLVDDMGASVVGPVAREGSVKTPSIDGIGTAGMMSTAGYAEPQCVPARTLLLTGRHPQRASVGSVYANGPYPLKNINTVAERLRAGGYETRIVGKWHLGFLAGQKPLDRGFEHWLGFEGTTPLYSGHDPKAPLWRDTAKTQNVGSVTTTLTDEAVAILKAPRDRPLFLYVALTAMHDPMPPGGHSPIIAEIEESVRRVREALPPNTLFMFAGDNGRDKNAKLRGGKYETYEGGVRVPFMMMWPERIAPGQVWTAPVTLADWAPTAMAAAELTDGTPAFDGINLLGEVPAGRPIFFVGYNKNGYAVRQGHWKLYVDTAPEGAAVIPLQLYDLAVDPGETKNIYRSKPVLVENLKKLIEDFKVSLNDVPQ